MVSWLQFLARSHPAFSKWLGTVAGTTFTVVAQGLVFLFFPILFSKAEALADFLNLAGLRRRVTLVGWYGAWVAVCIALIDSYGASKGWTASSTQSYSPAHDTPGATQAFFVLKSVMVVPFYEEVALRGFLYSAFRRGYGTPLSTLIVVCMSAYLHWRSISQSVFTSACLLSLWVLLCVIRERTVSLWNCLVSHAAYNAFSMHLSAATTICLLITLAFVARNPPLRSRKECRDQEDTNPRDS